LRIELGSLRHRERAHSLRGVGLDALAREERVLEREEQILERARRSVASARAARDLRAQLDHLERERLAVGGPADAAALVREVGEEALVLAL
jgi:hypothetical protein